MTVKPRFGDARKMINRGYVRTIREIFLFTSITEVAQTLKIGEPFLLKIVETPHIYRFVNIFRLANVLGVSTRKIIDLAYTQFEEEQSENFERFFSELMRKRKKRLKAQQRKAKSRIQLKN